jgi:hypothetical protein
MLHDIVSSEKIAKFVHNVLSILQLVEMVQLLASLILFV